MIHSCLVMRTLSCHTQQTHAPLSLPRCWFYFGRAVELGRTLLCSSQPDPLVASFQNTPTLRAYQYGWFEMYLTDSGRGALWLGIQEQYNYVMMTNFYTCGVTVQPLNSTTVSLSLVQFRERAMHMHVPV